MSEDQATQGREASDAHIWGEDGAEVFEDQKDQRATRLRWIALLAPGRLGRVLVAGALILTALAILDSPPTSKPVSVAGRPGAGQIAEATSAGQPTVVAAEQTEPEASVPEAADREEAQLESPSPHKEPVQVAASELDRDRAPLEAVLLATESWARAWSEQRLDDYLASYSPDFTPPLSLDLAAWKSERRRRLLAPRYIGVTLNEVVVEVHDDSHASASFLQTYESNSYADVIRKTLSWIREGASWKIVAEKRP